MIVQTLRLNERLATRSAELALLEALSDGTEPAGAIAARAQSLGVDLEHPHTAATFHVLEPRASNAVPGAGARAPARGAALALRGQRRRAPRGRAAGPPPGRRPGCDHGRPRGDARGDRERARNASDRRHLGGWHRRSRPTAAPSPRRATRARSARRSAAPTGSSRTRRSERSGISGRSPAHPRATRSRIGCASCAITTHGTDRSCSRRSRGISRSTATASAPRSACTCTATRSACGWSGSRS